MFNLVSKYKPTGDQPRAIKELVEGLKKGEDNQTLLGVTGSGKTFTIANIIKETGRPALIMAPNKTLAAQLYSEYKKFFPENAVEYFVSYYDYYQPEAYIPSSDTFIEKDSSINDEIDKLRHSATAALLTRKDVIIIASVSAIYGLGSPETYEKMSLAIDAKVGMDRKAVIEKLIQLRYERNDVAFERGTFRIKGDVIDVYPVYQETGYRFEYFGDDLESISEINTLTGKSIVRNIPRLMLMPANHYLTEDNRIEKIIEEVKEDLEKQVKKFNELDKPLEAQRIRQRTEYDIEMIKEIGYCKGIENYSRYLSGKKEGEKPHTLLEYFPKDFITFIDESHIGLSQIGGMYNGDRSRKETLVENGFRLPSALDNRPLKFQEFKETVGQMIFVSATPGDYEIENSKRIAEQLVRPTGIVEPEITIKPTKNQVDDLLEEIQIRIERKERGLVTTLTKKMAEELTEYYSELGIKVRYMHSGIDTLERVEIIRGLRKREFDVLVGINLLREGLDIPEVSLVAILEADKEGFLRSRRSLIQTMGRAARNVGGEVILYGDTMTKSMKAAIDETNRRKKHQMEYNIKYNIDPRSTINELSEDQLNLDYPEELGKIAEETMTYRSKKDIIKEVEKIKEEIKVLVEELNFEEAIEKRDKMQRLEKLILEL